MCCESESETPKTGSVLKSKMCVSRSIKQTCVFERIEALSHFAEKPKRGDGLLDLLLRHVRSMC